MDLTVTQLALRLLLAVVFIGMGVLHFVPAPQRTMAAMIPPLLRWKGAFRPRNLVIVSGLCEIVGGIGLVIPWTTTIAGICLVVLLVALFPANAYAAAHRERFGAVATPLIPRLIGQLVLIVLVIAAILPA
ncbi:MAG: DoxX family protein [Terrimesophilobacter sp.]